MFPTIIPRFGLALALVLSLPASTLAQADPGTPEGAQWHLTSYTADGETVTVPWSVDATLELESGAASGFGGCNRFSGSYALDGDSLTFADAISRTFAACTGEGQTVEDAYLANLPVTATWAIEGDTLSLADSAGDVILTFEQGVLSLTMSDVAALTALLADQQAQIDRLGGRLDSIRIGYLRERIRTLESQVKVLQAAAASGGNTTSSAFTAAERTLLGAIPSRTRQGCTAIRGNALPSGAVAGIGCKPTNRILEKQDYYLMEYADAISTLRTVAAAKGVPQRRPRCDQQRPGWIDYGAPVGAEACWIENGAANVRLVAQANSCRQLDAGSTHLTEPVVYLALEGKDRQMEPVRAAGLAYTDADYLLLNFDVARPIEQDGQPQTPACR